MWIQLQAWNPLIVKTYKCNTVLVFVCKSAKKKSVSTISNQSVIYSDNCADPYSGALSRLDRFSLGCGIRIRVCEIWRTNLSKNVGK